jgi:prepilin-type N-terminal cleavage/methylation domain-containing protein
MLTLHRNDRGVTLLEMAIVLVVLGIFLALAVPRFVKTLPGMKLKGDTHNVVSVLRLARMRALTERAQYGVYFIAHGDLHRYIIFKDVNENERFNAEGDEIMFSRELYKRVLLRQVNFPDDVALFKANGTSNGGTITLGLSERSDSLVVDILPSTGRVKVIP